MLTFHRNKTLLNISFVRFSSKLSKRKSNKIFQFFRKLWFHHYWKMIYDIIPMFFYKNTHKLKHPCQSVEKKENQISVGTFSANDDFTAVQGGRTWQPFVGSKNGNENFCQARNYNFRDKCVVFARNRKFANLTQ